MVGSDQERRAETLIVPDDNSGVILVRASEEVNSGDRQPCSPRSIATPPASSRFAPSSLERADAEAVASAVQRFFDDRAQIASAGTRSPGAGDDASRSSATPPARPILVAASDRGLRGGAASSWPGSTRPKQRHRAELPGRCSFVYAKATEIEQTVNELLIDDLTWGQGPIFFWWRRVRRARPERANNRGTLAVRADSRLNALIMPPVRATSSTIVDRRSIDVLDAPPGEGDRADRAALPVASTPSPGLVAEVVREVFTEHGASAAVVGAARPHRGEGARGRADVGRCSSPRPSESTTRSPPSIRHHRRRGGDARSARSAVRAARVRRGERRSSARSERVRAPIARAATGTTQGADRLDHRRARRPTRWWSRRRRGRPGDRSATSSCGSTSRTSPVTVRDRDRGMLEDGDAEEIGRIIARAVQRVAGRAGQGVVVTAGHPHQQPHHQRPAPAVRAGAGTRPTSSTRRARATRRSSGPTPSKGARAD